MTDKPIDLDGHRGIAAQRATELRRLASEVEADQVSLRRRQEELERRLLAEPATTWPEAAGKARYLLGVLAAIESKGDARVAALIAAVLADFDRLERQDP
jgi:hypothetical protein